MRKKRPVRGVYGNFPLMPVLYREKIMAKQIIIGGLTFSSKKKAKDFFRNIRDKYAIGEKTSDEDTRYLIDLINIHPEAEQKLGCGISHFSVGIDQHYGMTKHFVIHRTDGSTTDVSFIQAIDGKNVRQDRLVALRTAVDDQILDFRTQCFSCQEVYICPLRKITVTQDTYHIDHTPPNTFMVLVDNWLKNRNLKISDIEITPSKDNQVISEMINISQKTDWQQYHRANATLRLLSPIGNLSDAKKQ